MAPKAPETSYEALGPDLTGGVQQLMLGLGMSPYKCLPKDRQHVIFKSMKSSFLD